MISQFAAATEQYQERQQKSFRCLGLSFAKALLTDFGLLSTWNTLKPFTPYLSVNAITCFVC
jgi:hypothetical protein